MAKQIRESGFGAGGAGALDNAGVDPRHIEAILKVRGLGERRGKPLGEMTDEVALAKAVKAADAADARRNAMLEVGGASFRGASRRSTSDDFGLTTPNLGLESGSISAPAT